MLSGLPPEEAAFYGGEENLISDLPMLWEEKTEPGIDGSRAEYAKFMRRLLSVNMCILRTQRAKATNSVFFLKKPNGKLRFIISALMANAWCLPPRSVDLGGPCAVAGMQVATEDPKVKSFFGSKSDLSDFYFQIGVPEELMELFGLPPLMS